MKIATVPVSQAVGFILLHHQAGPDGRKVFKKGHRLTAEDMPSLQALGREQVYVAILDADDADENEAARRLGELIAGTNISPTSATTGRVNLLATSAGLLRVNIEALRAFNSLEGITLATLNNFSLAQPKKMVGTIKVIPFGLPRALLQDAEMIIRQYNGLMEIRPFTKHQAVLITTGNEAVREKVMADFTPALRDRLATYGTTMVAGPYVAEDEGLIAQALRQALDSGAEMILIAGETSIMDVDDITPRAIRAVGGEIVQYGLPVEPGNLMLLAYAGLVPIVGAPGCARSKSYNVVDMVLPRLAAGERLTRFDLVELGHGGLLD